MILTPNCSKPPKMPSAALTPRTRAFRSVRHFWAATARFIRVATSKMPVMDSLGAPSRLPFKKWSPKALEHSPELLCTHLPAHPVRPAARVAKSCLSLGNMPKSSWSTTSLRLEPSRFQNYCLPVLDRTTSSNEFTTTQISNHQMPT